MAVELVEVEAEAEQLVVDDMQLVVEVVLVVDAVLVVVEAEEASVGDQ